MPNDDTNCGPAGLPKFSGQRVLLVEDEGAVALLLEDMLLELGFEIGASASSVNRAIEVMKRQTFDFAVVDVNLGGEPSFPLARMLSERGVAFVFSTGYGAQAIPPEFSATPMVSKPFTLEQLAKTIAGVLDRSRAPGLSPERP